jgi:aryl-alcohol dehydrogenase-like predicted oxidoreductase
MTFGGSGATWKAIGGLDERQSTEMVARALDAGINFFDTADGYGDGESETILGQSLQSRRKDVVIATKVGFPTGPGPNDRGLSRHHIQSGVDASLRRLRTDYIDLYQIHKRDLLAPLDETMGALNDLVRVGKVRYLGVSNFPSWEIMKANGLAVANRWSRFESVQAYYNLAARDIEREIVPLLRDQQIGLMVWSPLAGGVLTGKYSREGKPPAGARRESFDVGPVDYDRVNRVLDIAREISHTRKSTIPQVTLAWLLAQEAVTSVIIGAKRLSQLEDNLGAVAVALTSEDLRRLDEVSALPEEYPGWFTRQFDAL